MKTDINPSTGGENIARRSFLRYAGAGAAAIAVMGAASCKKDPIVNNNNGGTGGTTDGDGLTDIGSGDIGILNYAYALEQLEAAFYVQVVANPYSGISAVETAYLTDIRGHEVIHRKFFKTALGDKAIMDLSPDFSAIDFSDRTSVLRAAKLFEDTGVQAYNGAGYLIESEEYLTLAGKIVSVEARHAALISNLLDNGTFVASDNVDANGLNKSATIAQVLAAANGFLKTKVTAPSFQYNFK